MTTALSNRERQARHRARQAQARVQGTADTATILAALEGLTRAVEALGGEVRAMRTGGGQPARNGGKPAPSVTSRAPNRDVTRRPAEGAPARVGGDANPLTGVGLASVTNADDAHAVLVALVRPGSVGAIRDALSAIGRDWSLERVTAALVHLQGEGRVRRLPGEGLRPDLWEAQEDPAMEDLAGARHPHPGPDPSAGLTVLCSSYPAHQSAHRWDQALGRFRCHTCQPHALAPLAGTPPAGGRPTPRQDVHPTQSHVEVH